MTLLPTPDGIPKTAGARDDWPVLLVLNAGAIIVAALYFGQDLLVPLALAAVLAFVLAPAAIMLQRLRLPRSVAVLIAVALAFVVIGSIGLIVGHQVSLLAGQLPTYEATVIAKWRGLTQGGGLLSWLAGALPSTPKATPGVAPGNGVLGMEASTGLDLARRFAQPLLSPIATAFVVLVFTVFILLASEDLRDRLVRLIGRRDMHRTILALNDAARRLSRFFLFQLALNSFFGLLIGCSLWIAGLPNPVLWGILAGCMRFVPFIGTVVAVLPPLLLAMAVVPGWSLALIVLALFVTCELLMGQVFEPLIYGHSTGLSPIAVIISTASWALLWGPVGLLLATPLTVCLVVIGRNVQGLAFLDVILGDRSPLEPAETFYQRALEGQLPSLVPAARQQAASTSIAEYYDKVVLPGLALAQGDLSRDDLAFERLEAIHTQVELFLRLMERSAAPVPPHLDPASPIASPVSSNVSSNVWSNVWSNPGAIVCMPGRGQLDDLAATMAAQVLAATGLGASMVPNQALGQSGDVPPELGGCRLCCLSVLEEGSSVSGIRYLTRRIAKRLPYAAVVICLWHAERDSEVLAELRADQNGHHIVLSVGELQAYTQTLDTRTRRTGRTAPAVVDLPNV